MEARQGHLGGVGSGGVERGDGLGAAVSEQVSVMTAGWMLVSCLEQSCEQRDRWWPRFQALPCRMRFVVAGDDSAADLHRRYGEMLARADGVPVGGGGRVDEDRVPMAALLTLVHDAKCLVDDKNLGVEDLLVGVEVEAATRPATGWLPDAGRFWLAIAQAQAVRPNGVATSPLMRGSQGPCSLLDNDTPGEVAASAPLLCLDRLSRTEGGCYSEVGGEGGTHPCGGLLRAFSTAESGV